MPDILVRKINEVYLHIQTSDPAIHYELSDYFSFYVDGYRFNPRYKAGIWDGRIKIYKLNNRQLPVGLLSKLIEFAADHEYSIECENIPGDNDVDLNSIKEFIDNLNLPFEPRDYQVKALVRAARKGRMTLLSPTSSGKSLILYLIYRWMNVKTLLLVPSKGLVNQMESDFIEYGLEEEVHIMSSAERFTDANLTISTWQNLQSRFTDGKNGKPDIQEILAEYEMILVDECHQAASKELAYILENAKNIKYRMGFTGTLQNSKTNPTVIQGLLGPIYQDITTKELMDRGDVADLTIKALILNYPSEERKIVSGLKYQDEIDYICANQYRNKFIRNLAKSLDGNVMIMFDYIEKHGRVLESDFRSNITDRNIYWISGSTDAEDREEIRGIVEKETNCILFVSKRAGGTGMSIKNINYIIFVSPGKAKIQTLQNIGRGLRKSHTKLKVTLFDIADNFKHKKKENHTIKHFLERVKIYDSEQFKVKVYNIEVGQKK